ncbi:unnamed protein product [Mytilus edulis]|uniref:Uncharacterized protein n=1 Tax=Mytilus edulis TaxID=6550 RepID=A0A8S3UQR5_MYTED|nr:unnamed protein product [Mytilus edulis]
MGGNSGNFTCRNVSVVDYVITSVHLLRFVCNFFLHDFSELFSDVHSPITVSFKSTYQEHSDSENISQNTNEKDEKIKKWNWDLQNDFKNILSQERKDMIFESLNQISSDNIDQLKVDTIFDDVCKIMLNSARNTFGIFKPKKRKKLKPVDKPWFDEECRFARQNYRKLKRNISSKSSVQQKQNLRLTEKKYKQILDKKINLHRKKMMII